jgi:PKD repeat protein
MLQNDPAYAMRMSEFESHMQTVDENPAYRDGNLLRIPVVVHVMHKGEAVGVGSNVSDAAIRQAIQNLNNMYRRRAPWLGNGVDTEIEFALAVRDPNGNCTNGITRVSMTGNATYMASGVSSGSGGSGITDAQLKAVTSWDRTRYYNIYLVYEIDNNEGGAGIQGYAYFASSHGQSNDGAVMLAGNFTNGTSTTCAHELGHALNLYHTFEGDGSGANCPTQANGCGNGVGDCCGDIPAHRRSQSDCNTAGTNSCNANSSNTLFVNNYMDYSSDACQNMFTANQTTRMRQAITTTRASFVAASNLALVPPAPSIVDFMADRSVICSGQTVSFTDMTSCVPNTLINTEPWAGITHNWSFVNGGTTLNSTEQNPTMTFTVPGAYTVTLTVTTPVGTYTVTKPNFVVLGGTVTNSCTPTSGNNGNFGQTISRVSFNTFVNNTSSLANSAYTNFICSRNTIVTPGETYVLSVTANAGPSGAENFEVYIDYNNNGTYETTERVHFGSVAAGSSSSLNSQTLTANVTIPATATMNTLLRMRVFGEMGTISAQKRACTSAFSIGDVEDYGVYISDATAGPIASFTQSATTVCAGQTVTFTNTSTGNPTTYAWTFAGGTPATSTALNPTVTYPTAGTYAVTLTVSNADGENTATLNNLITVAGGAGAALPITEGFTNATFPTSGWTLVNTDGGATTWARSATTGLAPTDGNSMFFDNFNFDDRGNQDQVKLPAANFTGQTSVTLTFDVAYAAYDATFFDGLEVLVSTDCEANFTSVYSKSASVLATSANQTTAFNPTTAAQWRTETVDLSSYVGQNNVVIVFRNIAGYGNRLYVDNINIAGAAATTPPTASFTASTTTVCAGQSVDFTNTTTGGATSYAWTFTGGTPATSTDVNPTVVYPNAGTYTVQLVATNANGSNTATQSNLVSVTATPTITASTPASRCGAGTVTLGATASNGTLSWFTAPTGGTAVGTGASFTTPSISATTTYYVEASQSGCTSARTAVIATVNALPTVNAGADQTVCTGTSVTLTGAGASTYTWTGGVTNGVAFTPTSTATYTVTGTAANGCTNTDQVLVTVSTTLPVNGGADQTICAGQSVTLSGSGATSYTWTGGVTNGASFTPTATATYTVTGVSGGCSGTDQVTVTVNSLPTVNAGNDQTVCSGTSVTLAGSGATSYTWSNGISNGVAFTANTTTTYTVTGTANGCSNTDEVTVTVNPTPNVSLAALPTVCIDANSFTLNQGSPAGGVYSGNGVSGTTFNPTTAGVGVQTITYSVTQNGCTGTATGNIIVSGCANIDENASDDIVVLYPNPTEGMLTVKGSNLDQYTIIELTDLNGKVIQSWNVESTEMTIDLNAYASGNYMVKIQGEKLSSIHKIQIAK